MWRTVLLYGAVLAAGAFALQWLEFRMLVHSHPLEVYLAILALAFMALGAWVALRLRRPPAPEKFEVNTQAQQSLGLSEHGQNPYRQPVREAGREAPHRSHPPGPGAGGHPVNQAVCGPVFRAVFRMIVPESPFFAIVVYSPQALSCATRSPDIGAP